MKNNKTRIVLIGIISAVLLSSAGISLAQSEIVESDRKAIWGVLDELSNAMIRGDIDSITTRLSPNMIKEEYGRIKDILEKKFSSYNYTEYKFDPPVYSKIEVLEPGRRVKFKVRHSQAYKSASGGSGSSSGLTANFVMEKINGKWLILSTDFYTKSRALIIIGIITILSVIFGILGFLFWLWMLIDCAKRDFPKANDKIVWILIIIFIQIIGAIIYYFVFKRKLKKA